MAAQKLRSLPVERAAMRQWPNDVFSILHRREPFTINCTQSTYFSGAVPSEVGTAAALALPASNSQAMQLHLDELATNVGPRAHAVVILDQAR